jgi:predicted ATPase
MIEKLQLLNFKSFAGDAEPIPLAPVTVLVGANASGKSNIFDAFRFLQGLGRRLTIAEILTGKYEGGRESFPAIRGGAEEVCWNGEQTFTIQVCGTQLVPADPPGSASTPTAFTHSITCRPKPEPSVQSETLLAHKDSLGDWRVDEGSLVDFSRKRSLLAEVRDQSGAGVKQILAWRWLDRYRDMRFLDLRPAEMKQYVPTAAQYLGEYGENLSAIVRQICLDPSQKEQFLDWVSMLCAPKIRDIDSEETKTGKVMVRLVEGNGDERKKTVSADSLSDGTLRFMGYLAAMFSAPEGTLFLIEEIENGMHPTRVHLLVELLEQFAASRNLQIIATTHSSQVLLSLSDKALRNAVLCARLEESAGTITKRLGDLPHFEEVVQKTQIDRLFTSGWLELDL